MTLRFKRNLPLVLTLVGVLALLALFAGNQPIVSYTVNMNTLQTSSLASLSNLHTLSGLFSLIQP
jgi:hypothetical protein